MTTQNSGTHTVRVTNGPGSELIILSLHCLLRHEVAPVVAFEFGTKEGRVNLIVTGISIVEGIEGATVRLTAAFPHDAERFCPVRSKEREESEFVFTNYNHHTRTGSMVIPTAYLDRFKPDL